MIPAAPAAFAPRWQRRTSTLVVALASLVFVALPAWAQQPDLAQSRKRLDEIRQERVTLERQQLQLQGEVSDVGAALRNLERQRDATNRLVNEIEHQISGLGSELDRSSAELTLAQDNLTDRKAVLQRRLADIYRRGPLYTFQVLLTAESFGDLLTRYKYLYLTSRQDRALVDDVTRLNQNVQRERDRLLGVKSQLDESRQERQTEMDHYDKLAQDRQAQLTDLQRSSQQTKQKLTAAQRDEATITDLLATLEKNERANAGIRAARPETVNAPTATSGMSTSDIGKLDWPVEGDIVINFGPDTLKDGGVVRWTGIGIAAPAGTPVKAVAAGKVVRVQRLSTYGLGVVLQHGNGYYSLYFQLQGTNVKEGEQVARGAVVGTVGGQNSALKRPHLYFEIRGDNQIALDPIAWLKSRN
ncbi:MAG TPA: peptidoglycan DD-metalloendopeptidase family protein [Gemmatimonadales bacterium]